MKRLPILIGLVGMLVIGCGGGGSSKDQSATHTPTVMSAATATPDADAVGVVVKGWWQRPSATGNDTYIMGELQNTATTDATDVLVIATAFDADDAELGSRRDCRLTERIAAGDSAPFMCTFLLVPEEDVARNAIDIAARAIAAGTMEPGGYTTTLNVTGLNWTVDQIAGEITNTGSESVMDLRIMVAGYDAGDAVVAVYSIGTGAPLAAGETTTFTRQLSDGTAPPTRFEAYASGTIGP